MTKRDDRDQRARDHQVLDRLAAGRARLVLPLVQADRERIPVRILEHDQRQEVVVPRRHDREQGRRNDARSQQRQGLTWKNVRNSEAPSTRARLQQFRRDTACSLKIHIRYRPNGLIRRRYDHGPRGVRQAQFGEQEELGDRQSDARHADRADDDHEHRVAAREAELGQMRSRP